MRAAAKSVNRALATARLPYFVDIQRVGSQPIALSYELVTRVPWRIGARTVDVLRLRRLDALNIELGMYGATDEGLPVVLLDRIESDAGDDAAGDVRARGRDGAPPERLRSRRAGARAPPAGGARWAPGLGAAAADLAERDRLARGDAHAPARRRAAVRSRPTASSWASRGCRTWNSTRASTAQAGRCCSTRICARSSRADEKLRAGANAQVLAAAVDVLASATEAHEARHALDEVNPDGPPPPPALFDVMGESSAQFVGMADAELRAYLGELHDTGSAACWVVAKMLRGVYGRGARRTPHFFATLTILRQLDPEPDRAPAARLALLCDMPDAELRQRVAAAWQKLYGATMLPGQRVAAP